MTIRVKTLWLDPSVGLQGYIGAILEDGTQVALCSVEKWNLGSNDSLRKGWVNNVKHFPNGKTIHSPISESTLRKDGLLIGTKLEMQKWH